MLSIHNFIARALIDTGATHSFISCKFARNFEIKPEPLEQILVVEMPSRRL